MSKISNKALRELNKALNAKIEKKAPSQTTVVQASVVNATVGDLLVKIDGSPTNTPCESSSVSVEVGDVVTVRIANGKATITGNISRQATNVSETNAIVAPVAQAADAANAAAKVARVSAIDAKVTANAAKTAAESAKAAADDAKAIADATGQYFYHDASGAHVTTDTSDANLLANSQGVLVRNGENPLTSMTPSGFYLYDGQGSEESNVLASFMGNGMRIGDTAKTCIVGTSEQVTFQVSGDTQGYISRTKAQFTTLDAKDKLIVGSGYVIREITDGSLGIYGR